MGLSSKTVVSNWSTLDTAISKSPHVSGNSSSFPSPWGRAGRHPTQLWCCHLP